jgi:hypothetical protein
MDFLKAIVAAKTVAKIDKLGKQSKRSQKSRMFGAILKP